jgi:hypothetical protein
MIKLIFKFFLTCLFISFIIWLRLIRERLPVEITVLCSKTLFVTLLVIFLFLRFITLYNIIRSLFFPNYETNLWVIKFLNLYFVNKTLEALAFITNAPKETYNYFADMYNLGNNYLIGSTLYLRSLLFNRLDNYGIIILSTLIYIPRIVVALCYFTDVIYFHQFSNLYKVIWLLIIPVITHAYLYMCKSLCQGYIDYAELFLDIKPYGEGDDAGYKLYLKETAPLHPYVKRSLGWMHKNYSFITGRWITGTQGVNFIKEVEIRNKVCSEYISLITLPLYISGGLYCLCIVISNLFLS